MKELEIYWCKVIKEATKEFEKENTSETLTKGLSESELLFCHDIFCELMKKYKYPFYKCIDNIQNPMDLSTIKSKLKNNQYMNIKEFKEDINIIIENCYKYNDNESETYYFGKALESFINTKKWTEDSKLKRKIDDINTDDNLFTSKLYFIKIYCLFIYFYFFYFIFIN